MARREGTQKQTINQIADALCGAIFACERGTKTSIARLVDQYYAEKGYALQYLGPEHGHGWTKDGGATFTLRDADLFAVLDKVTKKLHGQRTLDFSDYADRAVGLPYHLTFTIR